MIEADHLGASPGQRFEEPAGSARRLEDPAKLRDQLFALAGELDASRSSSYVARAAAAPSVSSSSCRTRESLK